MNRLVKLAARSRGRIFVATIATISSLLMLAPAAKSVGAQQAPSSGLVQGKPWVGSKGITESVGQIMARTNASRAAAETREAPPVRRAPRPTSGPSGTPAAASGPGPLGAAAARAPQTVTTNFLGASLADSGFIPPDAMGAVGPTQYVVGVNGRIRTFNKNTGIADGALDTTMDTFFNSVRNAKTTSDPRVRYDRLSGRWIVDVITVFLPNRVAIAVSSGGTITSSSSFTFFFFQQDQVTPTGDSGCLFDYGTLGVDVNALYIGGNIFCPSGPQLVFSNSGAFVVRKSSILGVGPIVVTAFRNLTGGVIAGPYTPQGADNDNLTATTGYFIGVDVGVFSRLVLRRVSDPGGTPSISGNINIPVAATTLPITVPHLGSDGRNLDALEDRLMNAVVRNGQLWTVHNIQVDSSGVASTSGGRDGSRWYQIQSLDTTPTVAQFGTVFDSAATTPLSYWIPSIMASAQAHVALGGSVAGANHHADAWTAGRLSSDPLGTMQTPFLYTSSSFAYNSPLADNPQRWGDYSYVSPDPDDGMTMWTIQEYANATNSWGVRVAKLMAPPPATPAIANPASVPQGRTSVSVTITGMQVSGSGFFDPGPSYPRRIGAVVSGGVMVNSATYVSPTQVMLDLNTTGATAAAQDVSITNPDGQSATTTALLTVTPVDVPGAPTGVSARAGIGSAVVSWTPPAHAGGSPITAYDVISSGGPRITVPAPATSAVLTGLAPTPQTFTVDAVNALGTGPASAPSNAVTPQPGGTFHAVSPTRILDTRDGTGGVPVAPIGPGGTLTVQVAGKGGVPTSGVSAVVLNVTVTNTTASSFLTVYPAGVTRPLASNLNWVSGVTVPNLVGVALGSAGQVSIFNLAGSVDVIFDVEGWVGDSSNSGGQEGMFNPLSPSRLLDTRTGGGPIGPGQFINLQVTGQGSVPPAGVSAVVLNVTVTDTTASSFLTVWPGGTNRPLASNLNFVAGQTVPNRVIVKVGVAGQVSIFNFNGSADVVVDVGGWFTDAGNMSGGSGFLAVVPTRIFDSRTNGTGPLPGGSFVRVAPNNIPASTTALVLNATATDATASSFLTLWPDGTGRPLASDLNFVAGQTVPNLTVVKLGNGAFDVFNFQGSVNVVIDMDGFYGAAVLPALSSSVSTWIPLQGAPEVTP